MIRIRYQKLETGNLHSKPVLAGTELVVVSITQLEDSFLYIITAYETGAVLATGTRTTLQKAKLHAKLALKKLGATFGDEVRRRA